MDLDNDNRDDEARRRSNAIIRRTPPVIITLRSQLASRARANQRRPHEQIIHEMNQASITPARLDDLAAHATPRSQFEQLILWEMKGKFKPYVPDEIEDEHERPYSPPAP
ncbi:hypothetical protein [Legionella sp.]|uniref:hypothetical protein n=1 Tax=Legionella sp. TaxID=459 RepID=UPI0032206B74